jgi:5-(carboxyamino)imidazole ribonucleotide mutase
MPRKKKGKSATPIVGVIMGSASDAEHLSPAKEVFRKLGIPFEFKVVSAHRTPDFMFRYAETAMGRGIEVIIAAAGGAAHLPGMVASKTTLPVIGVPVQSKSLHGIDSLLSIVQMPAGVPVATVAIDAAVNAALLAARILAIKYPKLNTGLERYRMEMQQKVLVAKV